MTIPFDRRWRVAGTRPFSGRGARLSEGFPMTAHKSRRDFLKAAALGGAGFWIAGTTEAAQPRSANDKINFACIGVGGKGISDTADAARNGNVVALCDIDDNTLTKSSKLYPRAKRYN